MFENYELWSPRVSSAIVYILAGILIIMYPAMTGLLFANAVSVMVLLYGIFCIVKWIKSYRMGTPYKSDLILGVIISAAGIFLLFHGAFVMNFIPAITGGLLIADAVVKVPAAVAVYKNHKSSLFTIVIATLLPMILGIILVLNPLSGFGAMVLCFGAFLTAVGVMDIISIVMINRIIKKEMKV